MTHFYNKKYNVLDYRRTDGQPNYGKKNKERYSKKKDHATCFVPVTMRMISAMEPRMT